MRILLDESDRPDRWHLAVSIPSTGNPDRLEDAIEQLVALHPALRTSFRRTTNGWIRSILPAGPVGVVEIGGPGLHAWMQQPFDLAHEYPIRFARGSGRLIAVIHHLVADGASLALLARDLNHLLHGKVPAAPPVALTSASVKTVSRASVRGLRDRPPRAKPSGRGGSVPFEWDATSLTSLARSLRTTPARLLLASLSAALHVMTGETVISIGLVSSRRTAQNRGAIGSFADTVPVSMTFDDNPTIADIVSHATEATRQALADGVTAACDVVVLDETEPVRSASLALSGAQTFRLDGAVPGTSRRDLDLVVRKDGRRFIGELIFASDTIDRRTAERVMRHLHAVIVADPSERLSCVPLGGVRSPRRTKLPQHVPTAAERFRAIAARYPNVVAVEAADATLTFAELLTRAERIEFGRGDLVGIHLPASAQRVVTMVGLALKGAAWLPLDPTFPKDRRLAAIRVARPVAVIGDPLPIPASAPQQTGDGLAYVITTSGSTGVPKAARVPERTFAAYLEALAREFPLGPGDRILARTAFGFDSSIGELWHALITGATLVICPPSMDNDPAAQAQLIADKRITVVKAVPTLLRAMLPGLVPGTLQLVISAGEPLSCALAEAIVKATGAAVANFYGPAECGVSITFGRHTPGDSAATVPIGYGIAGACLSVRDHWWREVPWGDTGELWIAAKRREPEDERYVERDGMLWFRTGDRVRGRFDGNLSFVCRTDDQLKLAGCRVELGDVEAALSTAAPGGAVAVVPFSTSKGTHLAGWYEADLAPAEVRRRLRDLLPHAFLPARLTRLERLPKLPSQKVDRNALTAQWREEPSSVLERRVAEVWAGLFGVLPARDETIEAVGGSSLDRVRLAARMGETFGCDIPIEAMFAHSTVAEQAQWLVHHDTRWIAPQAWIAPAARLPDRFPTASGRPRTVLVTGATGSLGRRLIHRLMARGLRVIAATRSAAMTGMESMYFDLRTAAVDLDAAKLAGTVDAIIHAAARVDHARPAAALWPENVEGTGALIEWCGIGQPKTFHYISSLEARDDGSGYARTKAAAERLVEQARHSGLRASIHRPGLLLGHYAGWPSAFVREALAMGFVPADIEIAAASLDDVAYALADHVADGSAGDPIWALDRLIRPTDLPELAPLPATTWSIFCSRLATLDTDDARLLLLVFPKDPKAFLATQKPGVLTSCSPLRIL